MYSFALSVTVTLTNQQHKLIYEFNSLIWGKENGYTNILGNVFHSLSNSNGNALKSMFVSVALTNQHKLMFNNLDWGKGNEIFAIA